MTYLHPLRLFCLAILLAIVFSGSASGQGPASEITTKEVLAAVNTLPDAPMPQSESASSKTLAIEGTVHIFGVVTDTTGAAIPAAHVILTNVKGEQLRDLLSGANGEFEFKMLPAGSLFLVVTAKGFASYTSAEIVAKPDQSYQIPNIAMTVAGTDTEITVRPTEMVAAEQIRAEEKQRILGIVPNFYISYARDAAPLTSKQKYSLAFRDTFDPMRFVGSGIAAGIEQANNSYAGYGQGAAGYGKRYAAAYGDGLTQDILSHAVFPSIFHQDPRYFYQGTGSFKSRALHAISYAVVLRGDNGKPAPNYSYLLGDIGSGLISNLYYPHADRGVGLVFTRAAISIGGRAAGSLLREFVVKRLTTNVPKDSKP